MAVYPKMKGLKATVSGTLKVQVIMQRSECSTRFCSLVELKSGIPVWINASFPSVADAPT